MKKCKKLVFLLPILLTSCSSSPNAIYGINDYDFISDKNKTTLTVDLSTNDLINLLDSKTSFPLFFHSNNCSSCQVVKEYINQYVLKNNLAIYSYEYSSKIYEYASLNAFNSTLFPTRIITPRILFIKNGELSIEMNPSKFNSYNLFSNSMDAFVKKSNIYSLSTFNSLSNFTNQYKDYCLFIYNKENKLSLETYNKNIYKNINKKKTPTLVIDVTLLKDNDLDNISSYYSLTSLSNTFLIVEDSNIVSSINYESNFDDFINIINTYFE